MNELLEKLVRKVAELADQVSELGRREFTQSLSGTWVPTFGGFTGTPTGIFRYVLIGKVVICFIEMTGGTSNATNFTLTGPFTAATVASMNWRATFSYMYDNGARVDRSGYCFIGSGSNVITLYSSDAGAGWTNTGSKYARFTLIYEVA